MLEFIKEQGLWTYLKNSTLPIYIYGMGDGALKIINTLEDKDISFEGIFASNEFVRGHSFYNKKVLRFDEVKEKHNDFIALLAFASQREIMLNNLYNLQNECELYAPDVPVINTDNTVIDLEYISKYEKELDQVYNLLADDLSRKTFIDILNFKVSGKIDYLKSCQSDISEVYLNLIAPNENETYVDLGAYNGDTVSEFLSYTNGKVNKIVAFEPDPKNFKKLLKRIDLENINNIEPYNLGVWNNQDTLYFANKGGRNSKLTNCGEVAVNVNSVDNILNGENCTIIKFDVEGAEKQAIEGSVNTIKNYKPKLMVSAYHKNEDIFALPLQVLKINPNYKVYLRHHPYIPAWETNYYFV